MSTKENVFKFIQENQPCTKQQIQRQFFTMHERTIRRSLNELQQDGTIIELDGAWNIRKASQKRQSKIQWPAHPQLEEFKNQTVISNAFAQDSKTLQEYAVQLAANHMQEFAGLIYDLQILMTCVLDNDSSVLRERFVNPVAVNEEKLKEALEYVRAFVSNYRPRSL